MSDTTMMTAARAWDTTHSQFGVIKHTGGSLHGDAGMTREIGFHIATTALPPRAGGKEGSQQSKASEKVVFSAFGALGVYSFPPHLNVPPPVSTPIYGVFLPCFFPLPKDGVMTLQKVLRGLGGGMRAEENGNGRRRRGTPAPFFDIFLTFFFSSPHTTCSSRRLSNSLRSL